ncbi:MAG TPA: hypothetical protein VMR98_00960, partial [Candidatus Polarisedimenticolaceae bacterium]|nr:hypothetical protein [Candidatus Polarisedimenticolaceae bacterium]
MSRSHHHTRPAHAQRIYGLLCIPVLLLIVAYVVINPASGVSGQMSVFGVVGALMVSLMRLLVAFGL